RDAQDNRFRLLKVVRCRSVLTATKSQSAQIGVTHQIVWSQPQRGGKVLFSRAILLQGEFVERQVLERRIEAGIDPQSSLVFLISSLQIPLAGQRKSKQISSLQVIRRCPQQGFEDPDGLVPPAVLDHGHSFSILRRVCRASPQRREERHREKPRETIEFGLLPHDSKWG